jgi:hypothetical protein
MTDQRMSIARLPASLAGADARQQDFGFLSQEAGTRVNALGMGVLSDGTPFLTQRGLAALCGVENAHIGTISTQWSDQVEKPRITKIREILHNHGSTIVEPHLELTAAGRKTFGYREEFCLAVLEYYAFEAGQFTQPEALKHYRLLAGKGLREFIYAALGYNPDQNLDKRWQPFLDRVSKAYNAVPDGFFSIFREISEMVVTLGEHGVFMTEKVLPDVSVGKAWSSHWVKSVYNDRFGSRKEYEHHYPDYFPQSVSNPQHPWCYPDSALGEFRKWFRDSYISGGKFKNYMDGQVKANKLDATTADKALLAYLPTAIEHQKV